MATGTTAPAKRPRFGAWLVGGGLAAVGLVLLAGAAWFFIMPYLAPDLVRHYSPWASPVMRAELAIARASPWGMDPRGLVQWAGSDPGRLLSLSAFVRSSDWQKRIMALSAFSDMTSVDKPPAVDEALCAVLRDPDPKIRELAAAGLSDVQSIHVLEAMGRDPHAGVAMEVEKALQRLRLKLQASAAPSAGAADNFPPNWSVGDTWKVKVKHNIPNIEGRANTELLFEYFTKTYKVVSEDTVDGRPVYTLTVSIDDGSETTYSIHIDKVNRFLVDYVFSIGSADKKKGVNDVAPNDSLVDGLPGSDRMLLDFIVFPLPNVNEDREVVAPGVRRIEGYRQKTTFTPTGATVLITKSEDSITATSTRELIWKTGDKWPETAVLRSPALSGGMIDEITETLVH